MIEPTDVTMQIPIASATAQLAAGSVVHIRVGRHTLLVDHTESGPTPLKLMTGALAACSAMSARAHLNLDADRTDVEVVVTLDAGPPTLLYRRVQLPFPLAPSTHNDLPTH